MNDTTWTLSREASLGLEFTGVNFYDGTGFLVRTSSKLASAAELNDAAVCVQPGTSTELAVADYFRRVGHKFTPVKIESITELQAAYLSGRCDAYAGDASTLAGIRVSQGEHAAEHVLLPEIISKEPLGPVVRKGDERWKDIVKWTLFAMFTAEEKGLTSANVDAALGSTDPETRRLLGVEGNLGRMMGLDDRWAYSVIKLVGNYGEVWTRGIGPLGIPRGPNNLWQQGGLHYAPPIR